MTRVPQTVRRIAIVGAGASGLTAARYATLSPDAVYTDANARVQSRYLLAEGCFDQIGILEQRDRVGGVWNPSSAYEKERLPQDVPQENPYPPLEDPIWRPVNSAAEEQREASFVSPLYDGLETNIPHNLMEFSDLPFPKEVQLFPTAEAVLEYLEDYSKDVRHLIQFHTQVVDIRLHDAATGTWTVTSKDLATGITRRDSYDAIVAASGHYNVPYVPSINGISAWDTAYPGTIIHSRFYANPERYRDKKVIVIGNSASGYDIGSQIGRVCRSPLLSSVQSPSYFGAPAGTDRQEYPPIAEFLSPDTHNRAVRFENGVVESDVDAIIFCTGYLYSFPFLSTIKPPVITDGSRTLRVYQQLFYIEQPTLVFPALTQKVIPFPTAEAQAAVLARVWSGRLELPSKQEMYAWEEQTVASRGQGKSFHVIGFPGDADYINFMHDWAARAEPLRCLSNNGQGKEGPYWGEEKRWMRERFSRFKEAFASKGEDRHQCRRVEELGFDFAAWKRDQLANGLPT
jgi:cation diffusion facilitator CzcD-associated flavoprotein CzcO